MHRISRAGKAGATQCLLLLICLLALSPARAVAANSNPAPAPQPAPAVAPSPAPDPTPQASENSRPSSGVAGAPSTPAATYSPPTEPTISAAPTSTSSGPAQPQVSHTPQQTSTTAPTPTPTSASPTKTSAVATAQPHLHVVHPPLHERPKPAHATRVIMPTFALAPLLTATPLGPASAPDHHDGVLLLLSAIALVVVAGASLRVLGVLRRMNATWYDGSAR